MFLTKYLPFPVFITLTDVVSASALFPFPQVYYAALYSTEAYSTNESRPPGHCVATVLATIRHIPLSCAPMLGVPGLLAILCLPQSSSRAFLAAVSASVQRMPANSIITSCATVCLDSAGKMINFGTLSRRQSSPKNVISAGTFSSPSRNNRIGMRSTDACWGSRNGLISPSVSLIIQLMNGSNSWGQLYSVE
jgi:hypothetical protein